MARKTPQILFATLALLSLYSRALPIGVYP